MYADVVAQSHFDELPYTVWRARFGRIWRQGELVALIGPTGSGKTYVAADILSIRDFVLALSIKPHDDTLARFSHRVPRYKRIDAWPPAYNVDRALYVIRPGKLGDKRQAGRVYQVLNGVGRSGGWTIYLDDVPYVINTLGLRRPVVELINVGRSSGITPVVAMQQPTSVSGNVPSELKKQSKHTLIWKFTGDDENDALARIIGYNKHALADMMASLRYYDNGLDRYSDFLYYRRGYTPVVVRVR